MNIEARTKPKPKACKTIIERKVRGKLKPFDKPIYITQPLMPDLDELNEKLKSIWQSKWLTNHGDIHREFEKLLQVVLKVRNVSAFNNGTTALLASLKALDLPGGSEVITTPFTFPATVHCIAWNGLKPVFCDIEPDTMTIDADKIEGLINKNTSAILGVHVYGFPCDTEEIQSIADKYDLKVIYDAAHAFTTEINGKGIGTYGDISMFSFHATKLFHTLEGGCLSYEDDQYIDKLYYLRNFGIKNEEQVVDIGINGKMNEIQAAIGILNLDLIEEEKLKRKEIKNVYIKHLALLNGITLLELPENTTDSMGYFVVKIDQKEFGISRNEIYDRLKKYNVFARKYFYPLCSDCEPYKQLKSSNKMNLPVANKIKDEVLCLPLYGDLGAVNAGKICKIIEYIKYKNKIGTKVSV
jgi:dTDP-4-amino-4,6-dideoxygalactose transaminase